MDLDAIAPEEQERLVSFLISAFQSLNGEQSSRRFDSIYYAEEERLRLLVHADLDSTNVVLGLVREVLKDRGSD